MNILDTIRNARDGSMVDIRTEQGIDSFPIDEIRQIVSKYVHMERQTRTVNVKEGSESEKMLKKDL